MNHKISKTVLSAGGGLGILYFISLIKTKKLIYSMFPRDIHLFNKERPRLLAY